MRLRRLEPVLRQALRGPCALPRGTRLLVAVSGGADSTALLIALHALAPASGLVLHAAHLDHGLRAASRADARWVARLCESLGVPLTSERLAPDERGGGEAGLRTARRAFLRRTARACGATAIATAHTADDQLETLLMRLMRGTGLTGLAGIPERRAGFVRPLLGATREAIEADLRAAGQPWRDDATNRSSAHTRNRVRHGVVPALLAAAPGGARPGARGRLALRAVAAAREAAEAAALLRRRGATILARRCRIQPDVTTLDSRGWATYPAATRRLALRTLWARVAPRAGGLTRGPLEALDRLACDARGGARVALTGGWVAERDRASVTLRHVEPRSSARSASTHPLRVPGRVASPGGVVRGAWSSGAEARRRAGLASPREEYFAAEGLAGRLEVRAGRADETFTPFGRSRPVRLSEFLRRQPVSRESKSRPTVLADAGGILWVVGVRRAARAALTRATRRALRVHVESHGHD